MKISENGRDESATLQRDTGATGVATFDLTAATGWGGVKTFFIKLYQIGDAGRSTTFNRMSIHSDGRWLTAADSYTSTWRPQAIDFTTDYGDAGIATGFDVPVGVGGFGRAISSNLTSGQLAVGGKYSGSAVWNERASQLSIVSKLGSGLYTWVVNVPAGSTLRFFTSSAKAAQGTGSLSAPLAGSGYWVATLPATASMAVGVGYGLGGDQAALAAASNASTATGTPEKLDLARAGWKQHYDDFPAEVPMPQDFALHGDDVQPEGVTPAQIKRLYYTSWVGLEANIMEPTPETGGKNLAELETSMQSSSSGTRTPNSTCRCTCGRYRSSMTRGGSSHRLLTPFRTGSMNSWAGPGSVCNPGARARRRLRDCLSSSPSGSRRCINTSSSRLHSHSSPRIRVSRCSLHSR